MDPTDGGRSSVEQCGSSSSVEAPVDAWGYVMSKEITTHDI